jgi:hypothetical protein
MKTRALSSFMLAVAAAAALWGGGSVRLAGQGAARPRAQAYAPPRTPDGQPDLQGIWQTRNSAYGDLLDHEARLGAPAVKEMPFLVGPGIPAGKGVVEGNEIPYLPAAAAKKKENFDRRYTADPLARCYMPGVPRAAYLPYPFQIVQTKNYVAIIYEFAHTYRIVYTNGSPHVAGIEFWMGDSRGRWDGNTLVVDVTNFNDRTWFDMAGNHHSEELHVVERYTRVDPDTLQYEATIEDPKVFTKPWKISMPIYRLKPAERDRLLEYDCAVLAEEHLGTFGPGKINR